MLRILSTLLVLLLLVGTAAAFAVTERLKLEPTPISGTQVEPRVFSPVCECPSDGVDIGFDLRESDRVTVAIVDGGGDVVRTLVQQRRTARGAVRARWDGRDDAGEVVAEGSYLPRVRLAEARRTIDLPNPIRVDTTPPEIRVLGVRPRRLSPRLGDVNNRLAIRYEVNEPANALLFVNGEQRVRRRGRPLEGTLEWFGLADGARVPAGTYALAVAAEDEAGNVSDPVPAGPLEIRYIELGRDVIEVAARTRFGVRVETDAARFSWRFAGRSGSAEPGQLVLRAPGPGTYRLFVEVDGRAAVARVIVRPRVGP